MPPRAKLKPGRQSVDPGRLRPWDRNPRSITDERRETLRRTLAAYPGLLKARPLLVLTDGRVIAGNKRLEIAQEDEWPEIPIEVVDLAPAEARDWALLDNNPFGDWIAEDVAELLREAEAEGADLSLTGFEAGEIEAFLEEVTGSGGSGGGGSGTGAAAPTLRDRFLIPPFSILNARSGPWMQRKASWLSLGIRSEIGRGANLLGFSDTVLEPDEAKRAAKNARPGQGDLPGQGKGAMTDKIVDREARKAAPGQGQWGELASKYMGGDPQKITGALLIESHSGRDPDFYRKKQAVEEALGHEISTEEFLLNHYDPPEGDEGGLSAGGTSVFDPVLCELAYRWFCPAGGQILDPFAGGSVRGIVASLCDRRYLGIDLSEPQVKANRAQAREIAGKPAPAWKVGDARDLDKLVPKKLAADLVFSCPPYFDLEVYSDDDRDLSRAGDYAAFRDAHSHIIAKAIARLRDDRFAVWVISEIRGSDDAGAYRGLVPDTIRAFEAAGARFYNEAILVQPVGSLPIRVARQFTSGRKLGRTHQNVLVFCKGDARKATEACGEIEVPAEALDAVTA